MSPIVSKIQLTYFVARSLNLGFKENAMLSRCLPDQLLAPNGKIIDLFAKPIAQEIVRIFPGNKSADELLQALRAEDYTAQVDDLGGVYQAILKESDSLLQRTAELNGLKNINVRLLKLQELILGLGPDPVKNRVVATACIREALGFSGVRAYSVRMEDGAWLHQHSEGEEGLSRFSSPKIPIPNSEKGFINKLLTLRSVGNGGEEGIFEWNINHAWGYLYVQDRHCCDFVEQEQLLKDELGDPAQQRQGYGEGKAAEILYLIFGKQEDKHIDVYTITNWAAKSALFSDKQKDLDLLQAFARSLVRVTEVQNLTVTDALTKIRNRGYFDLKIEDEFKRSARYGHPFALLMFDVDHFKDFNDQYGHPAGDTVLKEVAAIMSRSVRSNDVVARYGGEEFALILIEVGPDIALITAERLCAAIANQPIIIETNTKEKRTINVTVSVGVANYSEKMGDYKKLVSAADSALYEAKHQGRNQVVVSH